MTWIFMTSLSPQSWIGIALVYVPFTWCMPTFCYKGEQKKKKKQLSYLLVRLRLGCSLQFIYGISRTCAIIAWAFPLYYSIKRILELLMGLTHWFFCFRVINSKNSKFFGGKSGRRVHLERRWKAPVDLHIPDCTSVSVGIYVFLIPVCSVMLHLIRVPSQSINCINVN